MYKCLNLCILSTSTVVLESAMLTMFLFWSSPSGAAKGAIWLKLHILLPVHLWDAWAMIQCAMPVVWMQNQLAQNKTHKLILNYINQVWLTNISCRAFLYHLVLCLTISLWRLCERLSSPMGESAVVYASLWVHAWHCVHYWRQEVQAQTKAGVIPSPLSHSELLIMWFQINVPIHNS